ncbi:sugar transporter [Azorhizobium oxalatiphilum]|uniref:Sugar transporter n=1 Tax=Azorhizobium oxalatiphilum TaxID=980631 RepID=A0A917CC65_9HYPH|nr:MFS transporter [Azorhizobium oxalatiphilum]GGF82586.1 sugar transporter [Azorhizobium oxalatiphilum]
MSIEVSSPAAPKARWYQGASRVQWQVFWSAYLGWALDIMDLLLFAMLLGHISTELGMDRSTAGMIASASLIATAFGGLIFGFLADRIGRTRSMVLSILCYSIGTMLCGFSQTMTQLLLFRIIVGLGVGGEWSAGAALITETWPAQHRGKVMAWVQSAFASGYALAAIVAAVFLPIVGWRGVFFFGIAPALLAFWIRRHTPEPAIWKEQKVRLSLRETVSMLLGEHGRSTAVGFAFTAAAMCGYWGLFTWIPTWLATPVSAGGPGLDLVKSTTWIVIMQVGAAAGFVSFGYVADSLGRKAAFIIYFMLSALCVPIYTLISTPTLLLVFGPVVAFFGTGFYSGFAPTFAELFPTNVRATAQGFIYNAGRAVSALAPAAVGFLATSFGLSGALAFTAGFFVLAGLIVLIFLPETKGAELQ